jgi:hypothetical protein
MGTCYVLIEPEQKKALHVDKAYWIYLLWDQDETGLFSLPGLVAARREASPEESDRYDWAMERVQSWMEAHCEDRGVFALNDCSGTAYPWEQHIGPTSRTTWVEDYPWGRSPVEGWKQWDIYEPAEGTLWPEDAG